MNEQVDELKSFTVKSFNPENLEYGELISFKIEGLALGITKSETGRIELWTIEEMTEQEIKDDLMEKLRVDNFSGLLERVGETSDLFHEGYEEGYESGFSVALKQARHIIDQYFEEGEDNDD